jgi:ABC-type uncharacterized transport system, permease component
MEDLLRDDIHVSFKYRDWSVTKILAQKLPISLQLNTLTFLLTNTLDVLTNTLATLRHDTPVN